MTEARKLEIALAALNRIARLDERNPERYVARCDEIAVEALVSIETETEVDQT